MNWNLLVRQSHRWLSIIFTATVVTNFVARAIDSTEPSMWITYSPLPPLFLMLITGLYLFLLPYITKRKGEAVA